MKWRAQSALNTSLLIVRSARWPKRSRVNIGASKWPHAAWASAFRRAAATSCRRKNSSHVFCAFLRLTNRGFETLLHHLHHLPHIKLIGLRHQRLPVQFFPVFLWHSMKGLDHFRIELPAGPVVKFLRCCFVRLATPINAIARDRVERISHRKDARADVDVFGA